MAGKNYKFSFRIDPEKCAGCAQCYNECNYDAAYPDPETLLSYKIDQENCVRCSKCYKGCPVDDCIEKVEGMLN